MKKLGKKNSFMLTLSVLLMALLTNVSFAADPFMDAGSQTEMTERRLRFEQNPDRAMGVIFSLKNSGYERTAYRAAKLYQDSGVSDFRLRNFLSTQDYQKLTDK